MLSGLKKGAETREFGEHKRRTQLLDSCISSAAFQLATCG